MPIVAEVNESAIVAIDADDSTIADDSPLIRKKYIVDGKSYEREFREGDPPAIHRATLVSRLLFFAEFMVYLGGLMTVTAEFVHYGILWNLPNEEAKINGFHYPLALISCIYFIGFCMVGVAGFYLLFYLESVKKRMWWGLFFGVLVSMSPAAIVIYKDDTFLRPPVLGQISINAHYAAVYILSVISMLMVVTMIFSMDLFHPVLKKALFYKLLISFGVIFYQVSLIVTIHSLVVHVGFGLYVFGISLICAGYAGGRLETYRRLKSK